MDKIPGSSFCMCVCVIIKLKRVALEFYVDNEILGLVTHKPVNPNGRPIKGQHNRFSTEDNNREAGGNFFGNTKVIPVFRKFLSSTGPIGQIGEATASYKRNDLSIVEKKMTAFI